MPKFKVRVQETTIADFEVEADDEDEACELAEDIWLEIVAHKPCPQLVQFSVPDREVYIGDET